MAALVGVVSMGCGDGATGGSGHADGGHDNGGHDNGGHDNGDPPVVDPNAGDELARAACHGLHGDATMIHAALDASEAEGMIHPGEGTYRIHLPDGGPSFVNLMLPTPHTDWAIFVDHPGVVVSVMNHGSGDRFDVTPENPNEACPDDMRVDARVHMHTEGHHVVELAADGAREILFQIESESGHDDGGHADDVAIAACDHIETSEHTMLMAASTPEGALAGDVMMTGEHTYHLMLPDGPAYAAIHLPSDHMDWAIFLTEPNAAVSISNDEVGSFAITPHDPNPACPGLLQVDARVHIHSGGTFVVEFGPDGPDQVVFNMVAEGEGHGDGGHDDHGGGDDGGHDDGGGHGEEGEDGHDDHA